MRRRRSLVSLIVSLALCATGACTSDGSDRADRIIQGPQIPPAESLAWAGFADTSTVEVLDVDEVSGIDTQVTFALRGSSRDVDRVLETADFTTPSLPGILTTKAPRPGFDLADLDDPSTGEDTWRHPDGYTIYRTYVRGGDGTADVLHVWANTT